ncbi:hypothetical protein [Staphylococcus phage SpP]
MENEKEKIIHDRITNIEGRMGSLSIEIKDLDDKLDAVDSKHSDRHLEMVKLTSDLKGSSKATEQNTKRTADALSDLVDEFRQSNSRTDDRFNRVDTEVQVIKNKVDNREEEKRLKIEEKKLSNGVIVAIISGGFILVQVCVNVIAPLFFGG